MITSNGLEELGFEFFKDFILQDDGDGVYIHDWYSDKPIPSTTEIEQAEQEYIANQMAIEEKKESIRASAMQKLVENAGLTIEEVKSFIKIEE